MNMHPAIQAVTDRIRERSRDSRERYLRHCEQIRDDMPPRRSLSCSNLAHGMAANRDDEKLLLRQTQSVNIGIVSAYNDMLSAHQPLQFYPDIIRRRARELGCTAQFAGGTPAMCDGVTQGTAGMELSLFSRDVIAQATAVALSHNMFDAVLCLGVCDKIIPGLLIGALSFGHLPAIMVPAGPMRTGLGNREKSRVRQRYAEGKASREELLEAESAAYHREGTCTFYGTANSNQMLMEAMGLHVPGSAFIHPDDPLRAALVGAAAERACAITGHGDEYTPLCRVVDERAIVNAMVALLATGGSTNHSIHWVTVARAAGIHIDWQDFRELSAATPLLARVYPNGEADVNDFQRAGGCEFVLGELLENGLLHGNVLTVWGKGLGAQARRPSLREGMLRWDAPPRPEADSGVLRPVSSPFDQEGGLRLLEGNLGRAIVKVSAVPEGHERIEAPARVFETQEALQQAFDRGELDQDLVVVVRHQGPGANGMPELHRLTPCLGVLQDRGHRVALVTDGRMSGASGRVPAAVHLVPEAAAGGPIACLRDGDPVRLDTARGELSVQVSDTEWERRTPTPASTDRTRGLGRELFALFREHVSNAEQGATILRPAHATEPRS